MSDRPQAESAFESRDREAKKALMDECCERLRDAGFGSVVVLGSWETEDGMTAAMSRGRGNWYAQSGLMQHLLTKRNEDARSEARADFPSEPERD